MSLPRTLARRHVLPGSFLAGLALTGTAFSLGAPTTSLSDSEQPTTVSHAAVAPTPIVAAPARIQRASRGAQRTTVVRYVRKYVAVGRTFSGEASWYGGSFQGQRTANGERFNTYDLTAASRTLPFGTKVRVCRHERCVVVRINDRGPFVGGRILDLSKAARDRLGSFGVAHVTATPVERHRVAVRRHVAVQPRPIHTTAPPVTTSLPLTSLPLTSLASQSSPFEPNHGGDSLLAAGTLLTTASGLAWLRRRRTAS